MRQSAMNRSRSSMTTPPGLEPPGASGYFRKTRRQSTGARAVHQLPKLKWPRAHNLSVSQLVCGLLKLSGSGDGPGVDTFEVPDCEPAMELTLCEMFDRNSTVIREPRP